MPSDTPLQKISTVNNFVVCIRAPDMFSISVLKPCLALSGHVHNATISPSEHVNQQYFVRKTNCRMEENYQLYIDRVSIMSIVKIAF